MNDQRKQELLENLERVRRSGLCNMYDWNCVLEVMDESMDCPLDREEMNEVWEDFKEFCESGENMKVVYR